MTVTSPQPDTHPPLVLETGCIHALHAMLTALMAFLQRHRALAVCARVRLLVLFHFALFVSVFAYTCPSLSLSLFVGVFVC